MSMNNIPKNRLPCIKEECAWWVSGLRGGCSCAVGMISDTLWGNIGEVLDAIRLILMEIRDK